tara:strand:+ start:2635 stop:3465 length:831 start_codon:yes stop_codon:yes gene_type:complete
MVVVIRSSRNVGFYSGLLGLIYNAFIHIKNDEIPYILWKNPKYMADENDNVFDYFFNQKGQMPIHKNFQIVEENGIRPSKILHIARQNNKSFREQMQIMFETVCDIKKEYKEIIDDLVSNFDLSHKKAIHIRRTDRFVGGKGLVYAGPDNQTIFFHLRNKKENDFYIATDCTDTYEYFKEHFDCFSYASIRSQKTRGIHANNNIDEKNKNIAIECFIEGMLLSKCSFLYRMTSNFTIFALCVNSQIGFEDLSLTHKKKIMEDLSLDSLFIEDFLSK